MSLPPELIEGEAGVRSRDGSPDYTKEMPAADLGDWHGYAWSGATWAQRASLLHTLILLADTCATRGYHSLRVGSEEQTELEGCSQG